MPCNAQTSPRASKMMPGTRVNQRILEVFSSIS